MCLLEGNRLTQQLESWWERRELHFKFWQIIWSGYNNHHCGPPAQLLVCRHCYSWKTLIFFFHRVDLKIFLSHKRKGGKSYLLWKVVQISHWLTLSFLLLLENNVIFFFFLFFVILGSSKTSSRKGYLKISVHKNSIAAENWPFLLLAFCLGIFIWCSQVYWKYPIFCDLGPMWVAGE